MCWSTPLPAFLPWHMSGSSGVDITPVMLWSGSVSPATITAFCKDCRRYYMNNPPPATQRAVLFWLRVPQLYKTPAHTVPVRHSQGLLSCCSSSRLWSSLQREGRAWNSHGLLASGQDASGLRLDAPGRNDAPYAEAHRAFVRQATLLKSDAYCCGLIRCCCGLRYWV